MTAILAACLCAALQQPAKAEEAGAPWPLRTWMSTISVENAGWYAAPSVPATQCGGQVSTKSGAGWKWPPLSPSASCQSREAITTS